jgi:tetratricopeptide (TPR) repeat protein
MMRYLLLWIALALLPGGALAQAVPSDEERCATLEDQSDARVAACTRLIDLSLDDSTDAGARTMRGLAYVFRGQLSEALEDLDEALRRAPGNAGALLGRAVAHIAKGELDRAIADLDEAIAAEPTVAVFYLIRGELRLTRGYLDAALRDLDVAVRSDPSAEAFRGRGAPSRPRLRPCRG